MSVCYHADAAVGAGVPQVVVQQLGGPVLEGFRQSAQQHGELRRVQLEQGDQHHLSRLHTHKHTNVTLMITKISSSFQVKRGLVSAAVVRRFSHFHMKFKHFYCIVCTCYS